MSKLVISLSDEDKQLLKLKQKQKQIEFQEKMRLKLGQYNAGDHGSPTAADYLSKLMSLFYHPFHLVVLL